MRPMLRQSTQSSVLNVLTTDNPMREQYRRDWGGQRHNEYSENRRRD